MMVRKESGEGQVVRWRWQLCVSHGTVRCKSNFLKFSDKILTKVDSKLVLILIIFQGPDTFPQGDAGDGQEGGQHEGEEGGGGGEEQQEEEHQGDRQEPGRG